MTTRFVRYEEAGLPGRVGTPDEGWTLCLQWGAYRYGEGEGPDGVIKEQRGYRFIWKRPNGHLQAARGQARLPSRREVMVLFDMAQRGGWDDKECDLILVPSADG